MKLAHTLILAAAILAGQLAAAWWEGRSQQRAADRIADRIDAAALSAEGTARRIIAEIDQTAADITGTIALNSYGDRLASIDRRLEAAALEAPWSTQLDDLLTITRNAAITDNRWSSAQTWVSLFGQSRSTWEKFIDAAEDFEESSLMRPEGISFGGSPSVNTAPPKPVAETHNGPQN